MKLVQPFNVHRFPEDLFINFGAYEAGTFPLPDETDTVVELELLSYQNTLV